jgi:hypothetical protein
MHDTLTSRAVPPGTGQAHSQGAAQQERAWQAGMRRPQQEPRARRLLLIAAIASFMLRLIGEVAKRGHLERQCQSNTRTDRAVLSVITLARQLIRKHAADFTLAALNAALRYIQRCCAVPAF